MRITLFSKNGYICRFDKVIKYPSLVGHPVEKILIIGARLYRFGRNNLILNFGCCLHFWGAEDQPAAYSYRQEQHYNDEDKFEECVPSHFQTSHTQVLRLSFLSVRPLL